MKDPKEDRILIREDDQIPDVSNDPVMIAKKTGLLNFLKNTLFPMIYDVGRLIDRSKRRNPLH